MKIEHDSFKIRIPIKSGILKATLIPPADWSLLFDFRVEENIEGKTMLAYHCLCASSVTHSEAIKGNFEFLVITNGQDYNNSEIDPRWLKYLGSAAYYEDYEITYNLFLITRKIITSWDKVKA